MFLLGTGDMLANLYNLHQLSNFDGMLRGLVIGPPTQLLWILLLAFTCVGTALYIPETVNTLSALVRNGETLVPITLELLVTMSIEHVPLSAVNYFVSRCRCEYATLMQNVSGAVRLVFVITRTVWYAHIEGHKLRKNDKHDIKQGVFLGGCALFAVSLAFSISSWSEQKFNLQVEDEQLRDTSLLFIKLPRSIDEIPRLNDINLHRLLAAEGYSYRNHSLVDRLLTIKNASDAGYTTDYSCNHDNTFLPPQCNYTLPTGQTPQADSLRVTFQFSSYAPFCPYGEIRYNYAILIDIHRHGGNRSCVPASTDFSSGWRLMYAQTLRKKENNSEEYYNVVRSPWECACVVPRPSWDPTISVC